MLQTFRGHGVLTEYEVVNCGLFGNAFVTWCTTSPKSGLYIWLILLKLGKSNGKLKDKNDI